MRRQAILVVLTRVGRAPIRMMQEAGLGTASVERHRERGERQVPVIDRADRPSDDQAGEEIEDGGGPAGGLMTTSSPGGPAGAG